MCDIKSVKAVKKDMKRLSHEVVKEIDKVHFRNIRENPFQSQELGYGFNMPRMRRMVVIGEDAVYHAMSRTAPAWYVLGA